MTQKLYPVGAMVNPSDLSAPEAVWGWEAGPFLNKERNKPTCDVPKTEGKVVIRYEESGVIVIDVGWGAD